MKIAIGAVAGTIGGPASYAIHLVRALAEGWPEDSFTVLTDRPEAFASFAETVAVPLRSAWEQPLWDHWRVPRALAEGDFDLYHGTKGVLPLRLPLPGVVTIHDLASYVMPETFSLPQRLHLGWETPGALRRARAVITVSQHSAADIHRLFPGVQAPVEVIAEAAAPSLAPAPREEVERWKRERGLSGVFCVGYLGTLQPRKNIDLLAAAFAEAAAGRDWRLLIAGRRRPGYAPACLDGGDPRIVSLGTIADAEIAVFLGALGCMVSPSSYEGFGLSFIEAMAAGCPVIGLDNSSVPEVVGDAGILVSGCDRSAVAAAIERVAGDPALAADLARRGCERAAGFSWARAARETREVYVRVLAANGRRPK